MKIPFLHSVTPPWRKLIRFSVSFFAVFFVGTAIDLACGPEPDPYDYYISFFHNNLQKDNGYSPFYFNGYTFLNGFTDDLEEKNQTYEQNLNVGEWVKYLGNAVTLADAYKILYLLNDRTDSIWFRNNPHAVRGFPDSLKTNTFIRALKRDKAAMSYFMLAKKTEPLVTHQNDWGDTTSWNRNKQHDFALKYIEDGKKTHDGFLKLRCFYQAQRLLHYGRFFKEANEIYDVYIKPIHSNSEIKYWALALKAGEEEQLGNGALAALLYAREFELCPGRRIQAYNDFRNINVPREQVIKIAKNDADKATIYGIEGFGQPRIGLDPLEKVYQTDPHSEMVSVLLAREVNKIEEGYLTPRINGGDYYSSIGYWDHDKYDSIKTGFINYIPRLKAFCTRLATEKKYSEPALGYLASAYLSWIAGDTDDGLQTLKKIDDTGIRHKLNDQKQLIKLLLLSQQIKHLDIGTESKLLPSLKWLDQKVRDERELKTKGEAYWSPYDLKCYAASSRDFYKKVLARMYLEQKDTAKAALCILKSERTLLTFEAWQDEPTLGFSMPEFWQTRLHSYHLNKILKWNRAVNKTAYLSLLLSPLHETTITTIDGGYDYVRRRRNPDKIRKQTAMPGLYDILGTAYLREHQYAKAAAVFAKIGSKVLTREVRAVLDTPVRYPEPFADKLLDHPLLYGPAINNKLTYALAMARLQRQMAGSTGKVALACYQMATGLYNTSYYGNAWFYTAYSWSCLDSTNATSRYYNSDYMQEKSAEKYFLKAAKLNGDPEFNARCVFMAAKCKQKQIPVPADYNFYLTGNKFGFDQSTLTTKRYDNAARNNPYFSNLKRNYPQTKFYHTAIGACSYLRDFLKGK